MPFADAYRRAIHFQSHGQQVGAVDEFEYERMADDFMAQRLSPVLQQCYRPNNDRVRLEFMTRHIGVIRTHSVRTFYIVSTARIAHFGGAAPYFRFECNRVDD